jgi:hypothetical protein
VFAGETVHLWLALDNDEIPQNVLEFSGASQTARHTEASTNTAQMLQKTGMHQRLRQLANSASETNALREELAIRYQLISPLTNYILVAERTNPSQVLPTTVVVPQMAAHSNIIASPAPQLFMRPRMAPPVEPSSFYDNYASGDFNIECDSNKIYDIPNFLSRSAPKPTATLDKFIDALIANKDKPIPERIRGPQSLESNSLPELWLNELEDLVRSATSEETVVASFWIAFVEMEEFLDLNREGKRRVKHWIKTNGNKYSNDHIAELIKEVAK